MSKNDDSTEAIMGLMRMMFGAAPLSRRERDALLLADEQLNRDLLQRRLDECQPAAMREWQRHNVAVEAMGALIATGRDWEPNAIAITSYHFAEAMMLERERRAVSDKSAADKKPDGTEPESAA